MGKLIIITGTPGVGKSTLAKALARRTGWRRLDLHRYYHEVSTGYDRQRKVPQIDLKKLARLCERLKKEKNTILDSHLAHLLPKRMVDLCLVLTCSNLKILGQRLRRRRYSAAKVQENIQAEIFQLCADEAQQRKHRLLLIDTAQATLPQMLQRIRASFPQIFK